MTVVESEDPLQPDQVLRALVALNRGPVVDPEFRPEGPTAEDTTELLGALLARVEGEIATRVAPGEDPPTALADLQRGWSQETQAPAARRAFLVNRQQRTIFDIGLFATEHGEDDEPPARAAADGAAHAAANLLQVLDRIEAGDVENAGVLLDLSEGALAQALLALYATRMQLRGREP